jgi:putative ATP-binding cassette transporter
MNWHAEISHSLWWLLQTYFISCGLSALALAAAIRWTAWGRQFWRLARNYLHPRQNWRPLAMVALLLFFALFAVRLSVLFSFWYNGFYSALQALDLKAFWFFIALFAVLASIHVASVLLNAYLGQAFDIRWRVWLNQQLTDDWLAGDAYYREQFLARRMDNPDQRIERDIDAFVSGSRTLFFGAISALVSLVAFTGILWQLSGPLSIAGLELPRAMVFLVFIYVIVATVFAFRIGRPLIRLTFLSEQLGANFRYALMRLREYAESIALYRGAAVERQLLAQRFSAVIANAWALVFRGLKFDGYNLGISQIAVVFPFILQAPRFFSGALKLGDLMQTSQAFGQVQDALSFFRTSYDRFAQYRAVLERLSGFLDVNQAARALPALQAEPLEHTLHIDALTVQRPDGALLVRELQLDLQAGQSLLIRGPSGCGKTSLLRALAGLWPQAQGQIGRPTGAATLFLSQRPYLPLGDLRAALTYPSLARADDEARIRSVLQQVQLGPLVERLDQSCDWSAVLSLGEQQRLAFARVLFNRPQLVFLDEATSATDEGLEHMLYALLRHELPQTLLVSVGHRSTLDRFHDVQLQLDGQGDWAVQRMPAVS